MKRLLACLVGVVVLSTPPARAAEHLVAGAEVASALQAAAGRRAQALARLEGVLAAPEAAGAAARVGASVAELRSGLASLSDAELQDLALRAAALETDPVAGLDPDVRQLLIIFLIVAIVILVFQAVD
jgi:hypothetical protein